MNVITKTIPQKLGIEVIEAIYGGGVEEFDFHMIGKRSRQDVGDYVYAILQDMVFGQCQPVRIEFGAVNPDSGKPRSLIEFHTPGEKLENPYPRQGLRGT